MELAVILAIIMPIMIILWALAIGILVMMWNEWRW